MSLNLDLMKEVAHDLYVATVVQQHGDLGAAALKALLSALRLLYQHIEPESITERLVVFKALSDDEHPLTNEDALTVQRPEALVQHARGSLVIQVLDNGEFLLWKTVPTSLAALAQVAVVYEYKNRSEYFLAKSERKAVAKLDAAYPSMFAVPTFSSLRAALDCYRTVMARVSTCEILAAAWADDARLFWKAKPEATMRKSLTQFLMCTLRGAEVRPEQIVDETHPVDIKVTWTFTNRLALIEIKWMGDSKDENGKVTTKYRDSRALDGAKQLADYLDANRIRAPQHETRGYLTVFDARRRALGADASTTTLDDGLHYDNEEIVFDPKFHEKRTDFEEPVRFFIEPKCA